MLVAAEEAVVRVMVIEVVAIRFKGVERVEFKPL